MTKQQTNTSTATRIAGAVASLMIAALLAVPGALAVEGYLDDGNGDEVWAEVDAWWNCYYPEGNSARCYGHTHHESLDPIIGIMERSGFGTDLTCGTPDFTEENIMECNLEWGPRTGCDWIIGHTEHYLSGDMISTPIKYSDLC